jgi:hypothetical protein
MLPTNRRSILRLMSDEMKELARADSEIYGVVVQFDGEYHALALVKDTTHSMILLRFASANLAKKQAYLDEISNFLSTENKGDKQLCITSELIKVHHDLNLDMFTEWQILT